jgi:hypothetical protein
MDDFDTGLLNYAYLRDDDTASLRVDLRRFPDPDAAAESVLRVTNELAAMLTAED